MGVGRFIGKLFGGGETAKDEALLRAYGKLPMYAEYRRLEVAPGAPTAFSQWMDAGRLAWARSPTRSATGSTHPTRLLLRLPETKELVVASVWDSRDSLGRVFPFSFFIVCAPADLGADAVEQWATASALHNAFDGFHGELPALSQGGDFYRLFQKRIIPLRPDDFAQQTADLRRQSADIDAQPWAEKADFDGVQDPGLWFAGVARRAQRLREQPDLIGDLALSCPLSTAAPLGAQVALWLRWFASLGKADRLPSVVAPAGEIRAPALLYLAARDVLPDDFQLLTSDARSYSFVEKLSSGAADIEAGPPPTGPLISWLLTQSAPPS